MLFASITLLMALAIASVAAYFAVSGIVMLFSAAFISAAVMGAVLEAAKLVSASWLHRNWKTAPKALKYYMTSGVIVLMFITSMGIYGYLSKAHLEHGFDASNIEAQIEPLDNRIERQQRKIQDAENSLEQLDSVIETLIEYDKISGDDGARAVRENQSEERQLHNETITEAQDRIAELRQEKQELQNRSREIELEVGPVIYIAELFNQDAENSLDETVRYVILVFIFVFDPMAVALVLAANHSFMKANRRKKKPKKKGTKIKTLPKEQNIQNSEETKQEILKEVVGVIDNMQHQKEEKKSKDRKEESNKNTQPQTEDDAVSQESKKNDAPKGHLKAKPRTKIKDNIKPENNTQTDNKNKRR